MPFTIVRQDITKMNTDAIVNAANTMLQMGGGVCGAIFKAAGAKELQRACDKLSPIKTGEAVITPGFHLPAKYVIHAAGPVYSHWSQEKSAALLYSAYRESLRVAEENKCGSIAFPLISSGVYGYPKEEALRIATSAITDFLRGSDMEVFLAVFDRDAFLVSERLLGEVKSYIDENYVGDHYIGRSQILREVQPLYRGKNNVAHVSYLSESEQMAPGKLSLEELIAGLDEPFADTLFRMIDSKGMTDVEVYKKANISRKLFSKIRSVKGYTPKKPTILALAVALELTIEETDALLERAGYAISHANLFDVIVEYFIVNGKYNIFDINQVLFQYDQPLLGA